MIYLHICSVAKTVLTRSDRVGKIGLFLPKLK